MRLKPVSLLLALCCLFNHAQAATAPAPYALPNTEVRDIRAQALQRDYQLFVALPDSYREGGKRYPVVFVTDADYAFGVVRNIAQRLARHAGMEEVIVVGLSYAKGDGAVYSRRRDYTPTTPRKHDYRSDMPGRQPAFGEAAGYARFIAGEVFPMIASRYRANMGRKIFVGHSYGSLLGLQIMLTEPRTFEHYILGSPSLWYDAGLMFDREQAYAGTHKDLPASVFFGIGGLERLPAGKKRSRSEEDADMVADLQEFNQKLTSHKFAGLTTRLRVFDDEDHASVFPMVLTHGLRAYLKSSK
ncbi:alpha/beta hydrolase [Janthinobacterium sp. PC23-8]|uniref:alpha/beta hydrolase n=1 Tax=Janthinobacterium sp. PC23-8 TaxID=2012679 RepID=UPI000B95E86E|nr:alpha/beta hydrolase-fold protein [Janthinobacterium sp. PC23-8]OYO28779.1 IroE protein [Janthinobacterium sp. PC23-8]